MSVTIRPLAQVDLDPAIAAIASVGWGRLRPHFSFYLSQPGCYPLVAEIDGSIVGTAAGTKKSSVGWIGHVIVHEDYRRRGIGSALVEAIAAQLEAEGCRTLLLISTELGQPIYERLGFRTESLYVRLVGQTLDEYPTHPDLRTIAESDLPAIFELDRLASGEDRSQHLRLAASRGWVVTSRQRDPIRGYYLPCWWGEGPLSATDSESVSLLLDTARAEAKTEDRRTEMQFTIPEQNSEAIAHLRRAGFIESARVPRMIRGEALAWRPELVAGRFSGALG